MTDPAAASVRATKDIDAVVEAASLTEYYAAEKRLADRGFVRDPRDEVICRWRHKSSGVLFDLMPVDESILGFSNRWYPEALRSAQDIELRTGLWIRLISAPAFIATKLEAFRDRAGGDVMSSHDLEDVINVVDGRPELVGEIEQSPADLREYVGTQFDALTCDADFRNCLPGLLIDPDRAQLILDRLWNMAGGMRG